MILDGKAIAEAVEHRLSDRVQKLADQGITPCLAVVIVGNDPASLTYVVSKEKACQRLGIHSVTIHLGQGVTQKQLEEIIMNLNEDSTVHGILVQLPLPAHLDATSALLLISPDKDVDGFHPINTGLMLMGEKTMVPCTPKGVMHMFKVAGIDLYGKHAVIVGRSSIVGKPMALLLLQENATVTICHSKTPDLAHHTRQADVLIVAAGKPKLITADMVKAGAVVVDVGINRVDGKLCGDVDFDAVAEKASWITPVPGGVGKMTIAMLMQNLVELAYERRPNL